mmetsp:Transcript_16142/g.46566  ORF Transcript_16142/g.46566 Transcript_16142/m.46566 type:complete len:235 (-) Transcript_16142:691-1395(-)
MISQASTPKEDVMVSGPPNWCSGGGYDVVICGPPAVLLRFPPTNCSRRRVRLGVGCGHAFGGRSMWLNDNLPDLPHRDRRGGRRKEFLSLQLKEFPPQQHCDSFPHSELVIDIPPLASLHSLSQKPPLARGSPNKVYGGDKQLRPGRGSARRGVEAARLKATGCAVQELDESLIARVRSVDLVARVRDVAVHEQNIIGPNRAERLIRWMAFLLCGHIFLVAHFLLGMFIWSSRY